MSSLPTREELKDIVLDSITDAMIPGKAIQDAFIESSLNKKYDIYSYNPVGTSFFSPFDFTPIGAVSKFGKGYKMVKGGKKMISMRISGFGRKLRNEGYTTMLTAVASKLVGGYVPTDKFTSDLFKAEDQRRQKEQSRVGGSLPSKPKTRGKDTYRPSATRVLKYYEGGVGDHQDSICRKGYRYDRKRNLCVRKKQMNEVPPSIKSIMRIFWVPFLVKKGQELN